MERRTLGKTGIDMSILGLGGFHLVELPHREAVCIVNHYLDRGGNYLETAESYGNGNSEMKVGEVLKTRRKDCLVASKSMERKKKDILRSLEGSLRRLHTDHLDFYFIHCLNRYEEVEAITAPSGALEGLEKARNAGKIRYICFSNHATPRVAFRLLQKYPFDACMIPLNYYDRFNFPGWEKEVIPEAQKRNVGIIAMKPFADGLLWRNWKTALRYVLSFPVSSVVAGANTSEYLDGDIDYLQHFVPMDEDDKKALYRSAPELGTYVCRQCGDCLPCPEGIDIPACFLLEGEWDRQMKDGVVRDPGEYALRDRLRFWFGNQDYPQEAYRNVAVHASACTECGICLHRCTYGLPIIEKLRMVHEKLTDTNPPAYLRLF